MSEGAGLRGTSKKDDKTKTRMRNKRQACSRAGGEATARASCGSVSKDFFLSDEQAG